MVVANTLRPVGRVAKAASDEGMMIEEITVTDGMIATTALGARSAEGRIAVMMIAVAIVVGLGFAPATSRPMGLGRSTPGSR